MHIICLERRERWAPAHILEHSWHAAVDSLAMPSLPRHKSLKKVSSVLIAFILTTHVEGLFPSIIRYFVNFKPLLMVAKTRNSFYTLLKVVLFGNIDFKITISSWLMSAEESWGHMWVTCEWREVCRSHMWVAWGVLQSRVSCQQVTCDFENSITLPRFCISKIA